MNKSSIFWISTQNKYNILKNRNKYLNHKKDLNESCNQKC